MRAAAMRYCAARRSEVLRGSEAEERGSNSGELALVGATSSLDEESVSPEIAPATPEYTPSGSSWRGIGLLKRLVSDRFMQGAKHTGSVCKATKSVCWVAAVVLFKAWASSSSSSSFLPSTVAVNTRVHPNPCNTLPMVPIQL